MNDKQHRRPLGARNWNPIRAMAAALARRDVSPNRISLLSIPFAVLTAVSLLLFRAAEGGYLWFLVVVALVGILGRVLCNIFDGMVAVEGGKSTAAGELFNEIPDRISDVLVLMAAGYATAFPILGWIAALLAFLTAYVRTLGRSMGAPADYSGPMSKQERLIILSLAILLTPITGTGMILLIGLILISVGCVWTIWSRLKRAYRYLES